MNSPPDRQKPRSLTTQIALMEAAEKLVAKNGIQNVSIKGIVKQAAQKNESVLQYHFKNLQGLIDAIHTRRNAQTQNKRLQLLTELDSIGSPPSLRTLCGIMVMPTFLLAKSEPGFRRYIIAFSPEIAVAIGSALTMVNKTGGGGESGQRTGELLRVALSHLDEPTYRQRMDFALRLCSAAMGNHARQQQAFRGASAERFVNSLIDALEGLLSAPVSQETNLFKE